MAINIARLRQQNLFPEIPDMSEGTMDMGVINPPPTSSPYEVDPYEQEQPVMDPRQAVNPAIAAQPEQPIGGPGSSSDIAMQRTIDAINRIYTPDTTSRDRFNRLLDSAPERDRPSALSSFAAFGMGLGAKDPTEALNVHEAVQFAPHRRNMQDWTAKAGPFQQGAQLENTANINERTLAGNVVTAQTQADRLAESARQADQKNEVARMTALTRQAIANNWKVEEANGRMMAYPPRPDMGAPMDLGPSGMLSEREKIDLLNSGRLAVVNQQGSNQLAVQASRNQGALATQGSRNAGQLAVQQARNQAATTGSTRGLLPSQEKQAWYNNATILKTDPRYSDFIELDPSQDEVVITKPGDGWFGPTGPSQELYDEMRSKIFGPRGTPTQSQGMPTPPAAPTMPQGGGPQIPGGPQGGQPQGTQNRGGYDFSIPAGMDAHGRQPQAQRDAILQANPDLVQSPFPAQPMITPQRRDAPTTPPPEVQAIAQLDQQIAALEAQLSAPSPTLQFTNPLPETSSVAATDNSIVGQRFRQGAGLPPTPPTSPWWESLPQGTPQGNVSDRAALMEAGRGQQQVVQAQAAQQSQQQQMMAQLATLQQQRQQLVASLSAPPAAQPQQDAPAQQQQPPKTGFATNKQTGQKVPVVSYDGGVTWEFK